ncbi:helix-turn-helix domain-containing protein [Lamprobacter modestohalophilus]|nr:helix-turn-helix domain-containing protein [Lamprobacter modestohalophilus]
MPASEALDPIHDAALAMIAAGADEALVRRALKPVRARWQGACYIRSSDPATDSEIIQRLEQGQHPREIARALGKHRSTVSRRRSRWLNERGPR